jgi:hypothetical protein
MRNDYNPFSKNFADIIPKDLSGHRAPLIRPVKTQLKFWLRG